MKAKQLANVLIKILGLSLLVHAVPGLTMAIVNLIRLNSVGPQSSIWAYSLPSLLSAGMGALLIVKSRGVADFLFKEEGE